MGAHEIARDISTKLRTAGFDATIRVKQGTWTEPAYLEVAIDDKKATFPFFISGANQDTRVATALLNDIYRLVDRPELLLEEKFLQPAL